MPLQLKLDYIKSIPGILKIIEIFLLLLAFSCAASYNNGCVLQHVGKTSVAFFITITVILWLLILVLFGISLVGIYDNISLPHKMLLVGLFHGGAALLLLIAASVTAGSDHFCWNGRYFSEGGSRKAGLTFGFFSVIVIALDAAYHIYTELKGMSERETDEPPQYEEEASA